MAIYGFNDDRSKVDISYVQDASNLSNATGILAVSKGGTGTATANANRVFAGPESGDAAAVAFRALVSADIPNLSTAKLTSGILPKARGGTGSATANPNLVFAGPESGTAAAEPVYRKLVNNDLPVLEDAKIPSLNASKIGAGTLPVSRGGTGASTLGAGILYHAASGTGAIAVATQDQLMSALGTVPVSKGGTGATSASANRVFAGPASGNAGAPAFRALVVNDLPSSIPDSKLASVGVAKITGTLPIAKGGTGVSNNAALNKVFAGPSSGSAGAPSFRSLVPNDFTGIMPIAKGGTGKSTVGQSQVLVGSATQAGQAPTWRMLALSEIDGWATVRANHFGNNHGRIIVVENSVPLASKTSGWTNIGSITFPEKGLWLVLGSVEFSVNGNGVRYFKISNEGSGGLSVVNHYGFQLQAVPGSFHAGFSGVSRFSNAQTYNIWAFQNSGSSLTCSYHIQLVQLSGYM